MIRAVRHWLATVWPLRLLHTATQLDAARAMLSAVPPTFPVPRLRVFFCPSYGPLLYIEWKGRDWSMDADVWPDGGVEWCAVTAWGAIEGTPGGKPEYGVPAAFKRRADTLGRSMAE